MSSQTKPTLIGAFVAGALALFVGALFLLGDGRWFSDKQEFVIYFPESINGLTNGAPVKFRGVPIGEVKGILIHYNQSESDLSIPVIISIDRTHLRDRKGKTSVDFTDRDDLDKAIKSGLRARLDYQSIVTGMLYIDLNYFDDGEPPRFVQLEPKYWEIPARMSSTRDIMDDVKRMIKNISDIDFNGISAHLTGALKQAESGLKEMDFKGINARIIKTLDGADALMNSPDLKKAIAELDDTILAARDAFASVRDTLKPDSTLRYELDRMLQEASGAARSFRQLAEYLDRNPSALITGRPEAPKQEKKK